MSSACTLAKAPDGNGGVYMALASSGVLSKLESMGGRHYTLSTTRPCGHVHLQHVAA